MGGNFNDIREGFEKRGRSSPFDKKCALFQDRLNACKLLDLGSTSHKFTWRGVIGHGGLRVYERLDMALSNDEWRLQYPDAQVRVLTRIDYSDHHHILVSLKDNIIRDMIKVFKFECA